MILAVEDTSFIIRSCLDDFYYAVFFTSYMRVTLSSCFVNFAILNFHLVSGFLLVFKILLQQSITKTLVHLVSLIWPFFVQSNITLQLFNSVFPVFVSLVCLQHDFCNGNLTFHWRHRICYFCSSYVPMEQSFVLFYLKIMFSSCRMPVFSSRCDYLMGTSP